MNRTAIAVMAAALISVGASAPAHADDHPRGEVTDCATPHERDLVHHGDGRRETQRVLDGSGRASSVRTSAGTVQREYRVCGLDWDKGRMIVRYSSATDRVRMAVWIVVTRGTLDR